MNPLFCKSHKNEVDLSPLSIFTSNISHISAQENILNRAIQELKMVHDSRKLSRTALSCKVKWINLFSLKRRS